MARGNGERSSAAAGAVTFAVVPLVAAATGAPLIGYATRGGPYWWTFFFGGAALVLLSIVLQALKTVHESRRTRSLVDERSQARKKLRDALRPVPELIAQLPALSFEARAERLQGIAQASATALYMLISPQVEEVRANVYGLDSYPEDRMVWLAHVGRGQTPGPFESATPRGDAAFEFIERTEPIFYEDLSVARPQGYAGTMNDYQTFIAVPIWTDQTVYGMVTVDAPEPHSLTLGDQYMVELVAELLAAAFEVAIVENPPQPASSCRTEA